MGRVPLQAEAHQIKEVGQAEAAAILAKGEAEAKVGLHRRKQACSFLTVYVSFIAGSTEDRWNDDGIIQLSVVD